MQLPIPRLASALLTLTLARFPPQAPIRSASSALGTTTILALSATLGTTTPSQTISSKLWPTQLHGLALRQLAYRGENRWLSRLHILKTSSCRVSWNSQACTNRFPCSGPRSVSYTHLTLPTIYS